MKKSSPAKRMAKTNPPGQLKPGRVTDKVVLHISSESESVTEMAKAIDGTAFIRYKEGDVLPRGEEMSTAARVNAQQEFRQRSAISAAKRAFKALLKNTAAGLGRFMDDSTPPINPSKHRGAPPAGLGDYWVLHPGGEILFRARVQPGVVGGLQAYIFQGGGFTGDKIAGLAQWMPVDRLASMGWIEWMVRGQAVPHGN